MASFLVGLPPQYLSIYRNIVSMKRDDEPNYSLLYQLLGQAMLSVHASFYDPFDWELLSKEITKSVAHISLEIPQDEKPDIPETLSKSLAERLSVFPEQSSSSYEQDEDQQNITVASSNNNEVTAERVDVGCMCLLI